MGATPPEDFRIRRAYVVDELIEALEENREIGSFRLRAPARRSPTASS
jgi:hypothetical protein